MDKNIKSEINKIVKEEMIKMPEHFVRWLRAHLIEPKKAVLFKDFFSTEMAEYWLVTDHNGVEDSNYRIIYSEVDSLFGLEMTTKDGKSVMMGIYGGFTETVENM